MQEVAIIFEDIADADCETAASDEVHDDEGMIPKQLSVKVCCSPEREAPNQPTSAIFGCYKRKLKASEIGQFSQVGLSSICG